jgi:beta-glucosidase
LARKWDVAILFLGTNLKVEAQDRDRRDLNLPGAQQQLMEAVYADPKTVLVLMNAGPLAVTWANDHLPAILDAWYPCEAGGTAIAQLVLGDYNPGGRLPYTVYASLDGVPPQNKYYVSKGFTCLYFKGVPLYAQSSPRERLIRRERLASRSISKIPGRELVRKWHKCMFIK